MELIAEGRDALVFALGEGRVLRRSRAPLHDCQWEADMMEWARAHDYPVPEVHSVDGPEMVLTRVDGPTMLASLMSGTTSTSDGARALVELLTWLHSLPPPPGGEEGDALVHLDLHPDNILLSGDGPVVIDWGNSGLGPAGMDVALSGLILAQVASLDGPLRRAAEELLGCFLDYSGPIAPADTAAAVAYRAADPTMTPEELKILPEAAGRLGG